jgi:PAS domain S-box-containing protein
MSERDIQPEGARSESRRRVLDAAPVPVLVAARTGSYIYANEPALTLLGYRPEDVAKLYMSELQVAGPELVQAQRERLNTKRCWSGQLALRRKQGDLLMLATNVLVGPSPANDDECYITLIHPLMRDRKRAEVVHPPDPIDYGLGDRDLQVLMLCSEGFTDEQIAVLLGLTPDTVAEHMQLARAGMQSSSRTEACIRALKASLIV